MSRKAKAKLEFVDVFMTEGNEVAAEMAGQKKGREYYLDPYFCVFNSHLNDAHERAMDYMETMCPQFAKVIRREYNKGIMGIFQKEPTDAARVYTCLVTGFVNINRGHYRKSKLK